MRVTMCVHATLFAIASLQDVAATFVDALISAGQPDV